MKKNNKLGKLVAGSVITSYLLVGGVAMAAGPEGFGGRTGGRAPGLIGTVSAISGSTLTVTSKGFGTNATATTYAVDASTATVSKNGADSSLSNIAVGDTVMIVGKTSGTNVTATRINDGVAPMMGRGMGGNMGRGVFGTVASVSGNTITLTSKTTPNSTTTTTYTIDATNAKVDKNGATSAVSVIAVGDSIMVEGAVTGTNVAATLIRDGMPMGGRGMQNATPIIEGNGQPVVAGNVTAVNGSTLTITNKSNVTYTIDATNAKVVAKNATSTITAVAVGDNVVVQGTVNGSAVVASSVIDNGAAPTFNTISGTATSRLNHGGFLGGIMGGIGDFFHGLFGF